MTKNYLLVYSEQLATDIELLCQNIKHHQIHYFKFVKVQVAFMQIFVKQITDKVGRICFLNLKLH